MISYKSISILIFTSIFSFAGVFFVKKAIAGKPKQELLVGFPKTWGSLTPSLQYTAYADAIMTNSFEPLVRLSSEGVIEPLAAKSWVKSPDQREIIFKIDTSRRFSNGVHLSAHHFKACWEYGLTLSPKSSNHSLYDALYLVEGASRFNETKTLTGVIVDDDETLRVKFERPIRMGLEYLAGGRLGVFIVEDGKNLGTGPYIIQQYDESLVELVKNPFSTKNVPFEKVFVINLDGKDPLASLNSKDVDIYFSFSQAIPETLIRNNDQTSLKSYLGYEYVHRVAHLNGMKDRFFSNPNHRKAMQALIYEATRDKEINDFFFNEAATKIDFQPFVKLQAGRIPEEEVTRILETNRKYIDAMIMETKKRPLQMVYNWSYFERIYTFLREKGVNFTDSSGLDSSIKSIEAFYKTFEADIYAIGFSLTMGDPDGIYHNLGKNGAITSPIIQRNEVQKLLEEGRSIIQVDQLPSHYQKVSRAILEEIPFVHFGFVHGQIVYNDDVVESNELIVQRELSDFTNFRPSKTFSLKD